MLKTYAALEIKIEDRLYQFYCEPNVPLGEVHDVLCKMKSFVIEKMKAANEIEKPKNEKTDG